MKKTVALGVLALGAFGLLGGSFALAKRGEEAPPEPWCMVRFSYDDLGNVSKKEELTFDRRGNLVREVEIKLSGEEVSLQESDPLTSFTYNALSGGPVQRLDSDGKSYSGPYPVEESIERAQAKASASGIECVCDEQGNLVKVIDRAGSAPFLCEPAGELHPVHGADAEREASRFTYEKQCGLPAGGDVRYSYDANGNLAEVTR